MLLAFLAIALLISSCSYKLVREGSVSLPSGIENISIPLAENRTIEAGLEDMFTQELIKRFQADGRVLVVAPGRGDADLKCSLKKLDTWAASYTEEGKIGAEMIRLESECSLVVPGSGSVLWRSGPLSVAEEYPVGGDYLLNEDTKERALAEVAADMSESVRSALMDTF